MSNASVVAPTAEEARNLELVLSKIFAEVERIDERIARDQQETAQLRAETRQILAQLMVR